MKRYLVRLMYNGAFFAGWQVQKDEPSVQGTLESVLEKMHGFPVRITGSGRTDAGVHALGQTFHFDSDLNIETGQWLRALNAQLPDSIKIMAIKEVSSDFHARYDVKAKIYAYHIQRKEKTPFNFQTQYFCMDDLDLKRMAEVAAYLSQRHDFTSYNATSIEEIEDQVRTIEWIHFEKDENEFIIRFKGEGFLRYMVRMLVAVLLDAGKGKLDLEDVKQHLESKDKRIYSGIVPACGLVLEEVIYD